MTDHHESNPASTAREQELELEVARLQAEIDALKGEDPVTATSRFLAMAAETVDKAVADARREADEIVEEISSEAEARRDEATRVAAEAEAMAEQLLADADRAQERVDEANEQAAEIKASAEREAAEIVATERGKLAAEAEAFAEVRSALDEERVALETYHDSLRNRVRELAEVMVSFMHTELPAATAGALEEIAPASLSVLEELDDDTLPDERDGIETVDIETVDGEETEEHDDRDPVDETPVASDPLDTPAPAPEPVVAADPWVEMLESAIPEEDRIVDMPDTAIDEIPAGPFSTFGGVPVKEEATEVEAPPSRGLFSRLRSGADEVVGFDDLADDSDDVESETEGTGLFGMLGSRLVEQTPPDDLADALEHDDSEDEAFQQFLDGDDAPDPSRDWLLRPEQS